MVDVSTGRLDNEEGSQRCYYTVPTVVVQKKGHSKMRIFLAQEELEEAVILVRRAQLQRLMKNVRRFLSFQSFEPVWFLRPMKICQLVTLAWILLQLLVGLTYAPKGW